MRDDLVVRSANIEDTEALARMCAALWPDHSYAEHAASIAETVAGRTDSTLPLTIFVAEVRGQAIGFVEVGLRSHADGCDPKRPVGFLEGWWVDPAHRRRGVGAALVRAAEDWARAQGCAEMGSDTWLDAEVSQHAHAALGYEVVDRCVHFRKPLR